MVDSKFGVGGGGLANQQYCLKWNNHQNNMLRVFSRLLGQEQFIDCILAAEGRKIKCHKMVLSACSSYFEHLFMNFSEPGVQIVILKDTAYSDMNAIVDFMYKGEINVSQDKLSSLLKTAENLKVKGLAEVSGEGEKKTNNNVPAVASQAVRQAGPPPMKMLGLAGQQPPPHAGQQLGASSRETGEQAYMPSTLLNGDVKRKRGRPRTLDGPDDDNSCFSPQISGVTGGVSSPSLPSLPKLTHMPSSPSPALLPKSGLSEGIGSTPSSPSPARREPTPLASPPSTPVPAPAPAAGVMVKQEKTEQPTSRSGTPLSMSSSMSMASSGSTQNFVPTLTPEQVASWGVIKMNDYLISGTRQQYWEEYFVKQVMAAVKNKEIDMKGAAELLGVSYGTLYGRYRETFGYLKHAWNVSGRPAKKANLWSDPSTKQILDSMSSGAINIKQAAEALGMEPAMLAYQMAGKMGDSGENGMNGFSMDDIEMVGDYEGEDEGGYNEELMEVQPDIIMEPDHEEPEQFDSIVEEEDPIMALEHQAATKS